MTELSVVIVNFNSGNYLARCINSLRHATNVKEVIVVDNASTDNSLDQMRASVQPVARLRCIQNAKNLGFPAANNIGFRQSSCAYVLFLNPDCEVEPGALEALATVLDHTPRAAMAGGNLRDTDGSEQRGARRHLPTFRRVIARLLQLDKLRSQGYAYGFELHHECLPEKEIAVGAISGACMCVRRAAIAEVGLLDEGYFMHVEDLDWCMRFRHAGWEIYFVPHAKVLHTKGVSSRGRELFVHWHMHRGIQRYYGKYYAPNHPGWLRMMVRMGIWLRYSLLIPLVLLRTLYNRASTRQPAHLE